MTAEQIQERLRALENLEAAAFARRFFKTGPGEYAEGDVLIGIRVPELRKIVKEFRGIPVVEAETLLESPIHEDRLVALLLLVQAFRKAPPLMKKEIYDVYLSHTRHINNWDLVDASAEHIVGGYLVEKSREPLYTLARSPMLWERRIAIMATFHFIKQGEFEETLRIAELLLHDREDLIQKAVGWMLREIGKRNQDAEQRFLDRHCKTMPRTMLRYAIERFPEDLRQRYLKGEATTGDG
jgi:3-methyladenine DNA glycosylase AlkD